MKVVPLAARDEISGWVGRALKVRVVAAPEKGRANQAVAKLLADALGVPAAAVRIVSGAASSRKIVEIDGLDRAALLGRFGPGG